MRAASETVRWAFHPVLSELLRRIDDQYREWEDEAVVTSGSEHTARHSAKSLHYAGRAVDLRQWDRGSGRGRVPAPKRQLREIRRIARALCDEIGIPHNWIDVVGEPTHIHVELQPKGPARGKAAVGVEPLMLLAA